MSTLFDRYTQRRPDTVRRILTGAHVAVLTMPGISALAIITGQTALALLGVFASVLFYATGYYAAAVRYLRQLHSEVAQARSDALTGLPTRAVADQLLTTATREASNLTVALADIDGLNSINNNFGHAAGDQYIQAVAQRLARAVPPGGSLVRQGGDEFTLLAADVDPADLMTAIGAAMAGPAVIAGYRIQPRTSVGIAQSSGGDAHHARACADAAMYTAKLAGGNHTVIYQPDRDGQPAPDGTRPLLRRRDINPVGHDGVSWLPAPGEDLLPLMFSIDEARTVHQALCTARDRWAQASTEARAAAEAPAAPPVSAPDRMNIEPTPSGYATIAGFAADQHARHARLADRIAPIIEAGERLAAGGHPCMLQRAGLLPKHRVEVVTVRHPEQANDHTIFIDGQRRGSGVSDDVSVIVVDVDLDDAGISQPAVSGAATDMRKVSRAAATHVGDVTASYLDDHDVDAP